MPEGHLIHRYAREQHRALAGRRVRAGARRAGSTRGRTTGGSSRAWRPSASTCSTTSTAARRSMCTWACGGCSCGTTIRRRSRGAAPGCGWRRTRWRSISSRPPAARRWRRAGGRAAGLPGAGPAARGRRSRGGGAAAGRLPGPVGAAVLDQGVWAGIGNAWRAELLFLAGLDPGRAGHRGGGRGAAVGRGGTPSRAGAGRGSGGQRSGGAGRAVGVQAGDVPPLRDRRADVDAGRQDGLRVPPRSTR